ncbi:MAG: N-acetylmuramoyl-L-alanine amidase-like domain-containing protein [Bacteroidota bacterium]
MHLLKPFLPILFAAIVLTACHGGEKQLSQGPKPVEAWQKWCRGMEDLPIYTTESDIARFEYTMEVVSLVTPASTPPNELLMTFAKRFIDTPYVAHTLEVTENEELVINLREMDCTTFVEYMLAMTLVLHYGDTTFWDFAQTLACIRYNNGTLDDYPSRLHYFSQWLHNNSEKGIIRMVEPEIESQPYKVTANFMSTHPHLYRQLDNPAFVEKIKEAETEVSGLQMRYIPKDSIQGVEHLIKDGDIIAFTTNIEGLDITHTGLALQQDGRLYLLHASTRSNTVEITPIPLSEYLQPMQRVTGILVARLAD